VLDRPPFPSRVIALDAEEQSWHMVEIDKESRSGPMAKVLDNVRYGTVPVPATKRVTRSSK
jgi:hypothetical protein